MLRFRTLHERLKAGTGYFWCFTLGLLVFGTVLDHLVNSTLYDFGLVFSWEWFNAYGLAWTLFWIFIGLRGAFLYWFSKTEPSKLFAFTIFITTVALWVGGWLDFLWFLMEGTLPPPSQVWWWMPFASWLGIEWTILHHAVYTLAWTLLLTISWYTLACRKKAVCQNPKFEIYKDIAGKFRFRLKSTNGEIVAVGEAYASKESCQKAIEAVQKTMRVSK